MGGGGGASPSPDVSAFAALKKALRPSIESMLAFMTSSSEEDDDERRVSSKSSAYRCATAVIPLWYIIAAATARSASLTDWTRTAKLRRTLWLTTLANSCK